jgi:tetratricopeptide (TPR) repeat protein/predicted Ser/Thr protein kinase
VTDSSNDELAEAKTIDSSSGGGSMDATAVGGDRDHDTSPVPRHHEVARGTTIGRYVVLDTIGSGTMGLVLAAIDPTLDRKVALKLVKPDREGTTSGRQRLLREAQAMAKLQHPNVVTVFEVGTFAEQVFLAMEYIAGGTLAGWIAQRHTRREIVDAFIAAGRGIAAAHRAGIVHRDFKPTNVLVAADGRVRVADFGLATAPELSVASETGMSSSAEDMSMTSTGAILGTPTYMAPEQHRGDSATARADQFAFAVALYEALYGEIPFAGNTYRVYADNVLAGRILDPPRGTKVPAYLRKVLLRALALEPGERYPDMDAMLAALSHDRTSRRRTLALGAGALIVVAGGGVLALHERAANADPCGASDRPIAAWDDTARTALHLAFSASTAPEAESSFAHTARAFDDRTNQLRAARRDACEATEVRHEQSVELLDRRVECLDARVAELSTLIDVLSDHPDATVVEKAPDAAASLSSLAACADSATLLDKPRPTTPAMRAQVTALGAQVDRASALDDAGKQEQAHALYAAVMPEIDRLDFAPLRVRAHLDDALALSSLTQYQASVAELREVGEIAAASHDDVTVAKAWIQLYGLLALNLSKVDEARALEAPAAAAVARAGNDLELHGQLEQSRGAVDLAAGNYASACDHFAVAVRELGKTIGPSHPVVVDAMNNYAIALEHAGRYDDARETLDRAIAIRTETLGPDHTALSDLHHQLGALLDDTGHAEQSLAEFQRAYEIDLKTYPRDSAPVAIEEVSLGVELVELDRTTEALPYNEHAVQVFRAHPGDDDEMLGTGLLDLADTYHALDRNAEAIRTYDEALAIVTKLHGADHVDIADVLNNEAEVFAETGDHAHAQKLWQRALAIREKALGPTHPDVAKVIAALGADALLRHAYAEAIDYQTRAIDMLATLPGTRLPLYYTLFDSRGRSEHGAHRDAEAIADLTRAHDGLRDAKLGVAAAQARLEIANVLWDDGKHADAIAAAKAAAAELEALDKPDVLASARAWIAKHH